MLETLVKAADDLRAFVYDSIEGRMESLSSEERPLSASYGDGDMLNLWVSAGSVEVKSVKMVKGCDRFVLSAIFILLSRVYGNIMDKDGWTRQPRVNQFWWVNWGVV